MLSTGIFHKDQHRDSWGKADRDEHRTAKTSHPTAFAYTSRARISS